MDVRVRGKATARPKEAKGPTLGKVVGAGCARRRAAELTSHRFAHREMKEQSPCQWSQRSLTTALIRVKPQHDSMIRRRTAASKGDQIHGAAICLDVRDRRLDLRRVTVRSRRAFDRAAERCILLRFVLRRAQPAT